MITLRPENAGDHEAVRKINVAAFDAPAEATIVAQLRQNCRDILSLVAVENDEVLGHILFSPATLESRSGVLHGMGLAPMAVLPEHQNRGIGSMLVREGLKQLTAQRCSFVIVLGHPEYYPRFGFERASQHGIRCQWEGVPDEAFLVLFLQEDPPTDVAGTARYRPEFDTAM